MHAETFFKRGISIAFTTLFFTFLSAQEPFVKVAGHVYLDHNRNGFEDGLDFGYPAVAVRIYADINDDHELDDEDPELGFAVSQAKGQFSVPEIPLLSVGYFAVLDRRDLPEKAILNPGKVYFREDTGHCLDLGFQALPGICYAVGDGSTPDSLMIMNTVSGRSIPFGGNLGTRYIEAICLMPGGTSLFAVDHGRFGKINLQTGKFVSYSDSMGTGNGVDGRIPFVDTDGLTYDPARKKLFATSRRQNARDVLYQIDTLTGRFLPNAFGKNRDYVVMQGDHGIADVDDIAANPANGMLYGISNFGFRAGANLLVMIDPNTGNSYLLDTLKCDGSRLGDVEGLGFNNAGDLFASTGSNAGDYSNSLFHINLVSAAATRVGGFARSSDFESCDCMLARTNEVRGRVFEDLNDNRRWDEGEKGIAGAYIYISPDKRQKESSNSLMISDSVRTDSEGKFSWHTFANRDFMLRLDEKRLSEGYTSTGGSLKSVSFSNSVGGEFSDPVFFGVKHNSYLSEWLEFVSRVPVPVVEETYYVASSSGTPDVLMTNPTFSVNLLSADEMKPDNAEMKRLNRGDAIFFRLQILEGAGIAKGENPYVNSKYYQQLWAVGLGKATISQLLALLPTEHSIAMPQGMPDLYGKTCNLQICSGFRHMLLNLGGN